jgi:hypothetical protein
MGRAVARCRRETYHQIQASSLALNHAGFDGSADLTPPDLNYGTSQAARNLLARREFLVSAATA